MCPIIQACDDMMMLAILILEVTYYYEHKKGDWMKKIVHIFIMRLYRKKQEDITNEESDKYYEEIQGQKCCASNTC